ncbi:hypothetical protein OIU78_019761 [Salix suchowensis]|nr:hypothetical protein OIU78_019761 [Salix suchowensis]
MQTIQGIILSSTETKREVGFGLGSGI